MREPLLQRVASGDQQAMSELLDRYGGLVYSLARRFCVEASEVDDAVQDVFVALWQTAARFDAKLGAEETFVSMVTRRRLIDRRRRTMRRREGQVDADVGLMRDHSPEVAAATVAERSEEIERAKQVIETLRPDQQRCLRMSIYDGLSHDEIATATGIPLGTVKTHVRRGLIALRGALQRTEKPTSNGRVWPNEPVKPLRAKS